MNKNLPFRGSIFTQMFLALILLWFESTLIAKAQFTYITNNGAVIIMGYTGSGGTVAIPAATNGLPVVGIGYEAFYEQSNISSAIIPGSVTNIGSAAFQADTKLTNITISGGVLSIGETTFAYCSNLTTITIPSSVSFIGAEAFFNCPALKSLYCLGNAPLTSVTGDLPYFIDLPLLFGYTGNTTIYYLPYTTGWSTAFPTNSPPLGVLWNAQIVTRSPVFGVHTNQFGFDITGSTNLTIVVEAATNLASPVWVPLETNALGVTPTYFSDHQWTKYSGRYYRLIPIP
ncbi:MAG: leucine-rich repeat domain-containing protein [Verrucomicrobiota bacterium]|jgi:hypothetical protein